MASAREELAESDLLASRTEDTLDQLSGLVASASPGDVRTQAEAAKRRARRASVGRIQAAKYLPAPAAGETSVLLYSAERQIAMLHRSDPEVWHAAALADAFPLTEAAVRKLLASFLELHWQSDIRLRDAAVIDRVWPALLTPSGADRAGLGWLRTSGKLPLMRFAAGNPDLAHYHGEQASATAASDTIGTGTAGIRSMGQMERLVAGYYKERCARGHGQPGFLVQAEAAEAAAPAAAAAAREALSSLVTELEQRESRRLARLAGGGPRTLEPYRFERKLEGLDFSSRFLYDK